MQNKVNGFGLMVIRKGKLMDKVEILSRRIYSILFPMIPSTCYTKIKDIIRETLEEERKECANRAKKWLSIHVDEIEHVHGTKGRGKLIVSQRKKSLESAIMDENFKTVYETKWYTCIGCKETYDIDEIKKNKDICPICETNYHTDIKVEL